MKNKFDFYEIVKINSNKGRLSEIYGKEGVILGMTENDDGTWGYAILKEVTYLYVKDICVYVKRIFNKNYSISGMTKWLQANDFCYKNSHAVPAKADKEKQKKFIAFYEAFLKVMA